jgi:NAD-dependent SIR2 family protein deacetylase
MSGGLLSTVSARGKKAHDRCSGCYRLYSLQVGQQRTRHEDLCTSCRYENTERRAELVAKKGIRYMGMGVSGGEEGARNGELLLAGADAGCMHDSLAADSSETDMLSSDRPLAHARRRR